MLFCELFLYYFNYLDYFCSSFIINLGIYMTQRCFFVFIFFISLVLNAYGAIELRSTQMRTSDGLPNNSVRYIYQDSKGFLWLATLNGLSRYDGNSFLTFRPETRRQSLFGGQPDL